MGIFNCYDKCKCNFIKKIPNPLFDLAGICCGHFLVPFKTFFLATFIGKAIFKVLIQSTFILILFNEKTV